MIPEAAVEAAAQRMSAADRDIIDWTLYKDSARAILEAAEPHMAPSVDASVIIAELRLFNHHEAAALIERLTRR